MKLYQLFNAWYFNIMKNKRDSTGETAMHSYSDVATAIGKLRVGFNANGIAMICTAKGAGAAFENTYQKHFGARPQKGKIPESFRRAIVNAAEGRVFNPVPLDLSPLPAFQRRVLQALQQVPRGKVQTYMWLARKAGRPKAARAVGNAMARNPVPLLIPCHRIVPAAGGIGNYGLGSAVKRALLVREGVPVENDLERRKHARNSVRSRRRPV
jgi:O-6-methylguanine DNA methyltransferase